MKIFITGAQGQVGQEMVRICQEKGWQAITRSSQEFDITKPQVIPEVDFVVNCAAYTKVAIAETESDQAFLVNAKAVSYLAETCKNADVPLIHFSTDYVFDGKKTEPYVENDSTHPLNVYGDSKCQGEALLRQTWSKHLILRVSWVFGQQGSNFVKTMLSLKDKDELRLPVDQEGSPTGARHIAEVVAAIISHPNLQQQFGTYHYTDRPFTNWHDFAKIIFHKAKQLNLIDRAPQIFPKQTELKTGELLRPLNSKLDCHKIKPCFGIDQAPWEDELDQILALLKKDQPHV